MLCPCGWKSNFEECCGPLIDGVRTAETAEVLMRSRYSAFATRNIDYLVATHQPDDGTVVNRDEVAAFAGQTTWLGLTINKTDKGSPGDDAGVVEFSARFLQNGREAVMHDRSVFGKIDGRWHYTHSMSPPVKTPTRGETKPGRNAACPCGSGKKHKRCCGA